MFVKVFAFADDLAITCAVKKNECASAKVNAMLKIVCDWCTSVGLTLARDKTEITFITGMRVPRIIGLSLGGSVANSVEVINYLGVTIDTYRKFDKHIETVLIKRML